MKTTTQQTVISSRSRLLACIVFFGVFEIQEMRVSHKYLFLGSFIIFMVIMAIVGNLTTSTALAQCGDIPADSSCITCHEYQRADPVYGKGEWHEIHALKDCCWNCHGGNTKAQDEDLAHVGMTVHPLQDIYTDCHSCHPDNYPERAERFAVALGVTPGSAPTPTAVTVGPVELHPIVILQTPSAATAPFPWPVAILGAGILGLFLKGFLLLGRSKIQGSR
jgi:hypothetical protein